MNVARPATILSALALASGLLGGEMPLAAQTDTFSEVIEVRVVNLEVVVTDGRGNRISGLKPEDFRLRVDGQELPIGYFTEIQEGRAVTAGTEAPAVVEVPGLDPGKPVGTSYLVFIDDYFTVARDRDQVLQGIIDSLAFLGPEDRMAVVAYDGKKLDMLTSWSQSREQLQRVLTDAMDRKTFGIATRFNLANLDRDFRDEAQMLAIEQAMLAGGGAPVNDDPPSETAIADLGLQELVARNVINTWERDVDRVTTAVAATLRSFARPPGRKVMLLLSGGWPESPVHYVLNRDIPIVGFGEGKGPRSYDKVHDTANLLGYTLYPIDVPPPGTEGVGPETALIPDATPLPRERELHSTLFRLAEETGGQPLLSGNRVAALDRVVEDTRSYYWLGFTPEWQGDDENHKIKLEVRKPGLNVRHREGYQDLSRTKEVSFMVESALMFGDLPGAEPLKVDFGEIKKAGSKRIKLPLEIAIPMDAIAMLPRSGQFVAELELRVATVDKYGDRSDMPVIPVKLQGPKPQPGQRAIYATEVKLRNVTQDIVVSLHDPLSGTILATTRELRRN